MTVNVLAAAKHMAKRSNWTLSNLQLQKLIYLAHMFHLGRTGEPLVYGSFEAWDYGPVHPQLYHAVKMFGSGAVSDVFPLTENIDGRPEAAILDEAYVALGHARPGQLVNATHKKGGAWDNNYIPGTRGCIIPNGEILGEFQRMQNAG